MRGWRLYSRLQMRGDRRRAYEIDDIHLAERRRTSADAAYEQLNKSHHATDVKQNVALNYSQYENEIVAVKKLSAKNARFIYVGDRNKR